MNYSTKVKGVEIKGGLIIKILSIVALLFTSLGYSEIFFHYVKKTYVRDGYNPYDKYYEVYEFAYKLPDLKDAILVIVFLIPYILLILYIFKFYKKRNATLMILVVFILISIKLLLCGIAGNSFLTEFVWDKKGLPKGVTTAREYEEFFVMLKHIAFISFLPGLICAFIGFKKKFLLVISMFICFAGNIVSLNDYSIYLKRHLDIYAYTNLSRIIGETLFIIVLFLFCTRNEIPSVGSIFNKNNEYKSSANELILLKEKLEQNIITEEEYQKQRKEIISKL